MRDGTMKLSFLHISPSLTIYTPSMSLALSLPNLESFSQTVE